jgi:hypothetical protein
MSNTTVAEVIAVPDLPQYVQVGHTHEDRTVVFVHRCDATDGCRVCRPVIDQVDDDTSLVDLTGRRIAAALTAYGIEHTAGDVADMGPDILWALYSDPTPLRVRVSPELDADELVGIWEEGTGGVVWLVNPAYPVERLTDALLYNLALDTVVPHRCVGSAGCAGCQVERGPGRDAVRDRVRQAVTGWAVPAQRTPVLV